VSVASNFEGSLRVSKNPWNIRPSALRCVLRTIKSMDLTPTGVEVTLMENSRSFRPPKSAPIETPETLRGLI
jgi:hypothetical protein